MLIAVAAAVACSSSSPAAADAGVPDAEPDAFPVDPDATITGTVGGGTIRVGDVLLVHRQTWGSGIKGETAMRISSTPRLCDQITSGKTTAPGKLLIGAGVVEHGTERCVLGLYRSERLARQLEEPTLVARGRR